ncbi:MAG: GNAT family N-acetyltransferase [Thermoanaerobaculia bacterium]
MAWPQVPAARGRQLGRYLLERAEAYARRRNLVRLYLSTTPFLTGAILVYERFGLRRVEEPSADLLGTPLFTVYDGEAARATG